MRNYAQIRPTFWTRGSGRKLRGKPDAQRLALYLMTSPASTMIGLYYQSKPSILHDLGMTDAAFCTALRDVSEIARYDATEELVWIPNGAREQMNLAGRIKPGDKRLGRVVRELAVFGEHPFVLEFRAKYLPEHDAPCHAPSDGASDAPVFLIGSVPDPDRETVCPLDLAETFSGYDELSAKLGTSVEVLRSHADEFVAYWTIGAGSGLRRSQWARRLRQRLVDVVRGGAGTRQSNSRHFRPEDL